MFSLAGKIISATSSAHSISFGARNISSLDAARAAALRDALKAALQSHGLRLAPAPPADADVQLTLSEGVNRYILVAEIHQGDTQQVEMIALSKSDDSAASLAPEMVLQRRIIWQQAAPVLDFARATGDPAKSTLFLLEPGRLVALKFSGKTQRSQEVAAIIGFPATRDLRGQIISADSSHVTAYIEGLTCTGTWNSAFHVDCNADGPLPPGAHSVVARRNYFTGGIAGWSGPPASLPPFYSAAYSPASGSAGISNAMILAELDGNARLYEESTPGNVAQPTPSAVAADRSWHPSAVFSGWGDNITSITTGCDVAWHVLVTGPGDWTQPDRIQLYEIADQQAVALGQPLEFPGPISALWPSADGNSARVVSRDLHTGMYEASIVSVSCGN